MQAAEYEIDIQLIPEGITYSQVIEILKAVKPVAKIELEAKILSFTAKIKEIDFREQYEIAKILAMPITPLYNLYCEHFGITTERQGQINSIIKDHVEIYRNPSKLRLIVNKLKRLIKQWQTSKK